MKGHHWVAIGGTVIIIIAVIIVTAIVHHTATAPCSTTAAQDAKCPGTNDIGTDKSSNKGNTMELQKTDEVVGTGDEAVAGKQVTVNYVGTLTNGTKFDSSYDRNQPFTFTLGGGQVIKGWDEGVVGMKVGGKRKLVIPASLGYGDQSPSPSIPANSTLVFEIELLKVQ